MTTEIRARAYVVAPTVELAGALLVNQTKRGPRLFGGKVKGSETIRECCRRELLEELGVDASVGTLVSTTERYKGKGKRQRRILEVVFMVRLASLEFKPAKGMRPEWVPMNEVDMRLGAWMA